MPPKNKNSNSSFKQGFGWTPVYVLTVVIGVAIAVVTILQVQKFYQERHRAELHYEIQHEVDKFALELELVFQRNADTMRALAAVISIEPDISVERFNEFAKQIFETHRDFVQIAAAPDLVVDRVFPSEFSEGLMARDYRAAGNEELLAQVNRAQKARDVLFAGPVDLFHGGQGIMAHKVLYLPNEDGTERFWGLVNLVIDFEQELEMLGLDDANFRVALRGKDARGRHGAIFWGDKSTFAADPVYATVELPIGSWVLAAAPFGGWGAQDSELSRVYLIILGATLSVTALALSATRLVQLRVRANAQMTSAINSIKDGFVYYNSDDRLVACNDKYREFHGGASKLLKPGMKFEDILRLGVSRGHFAEAIGQEEEWLQSRLSDHRSREGSQEQKLDDGRWVRMSESRTPDGGTVGILVDITELVTAKEEAERANLARSEFLDIMSHELRTPLTVILGGIPFLVRPELLPATQKVTSRLTAMEASGEVLGKDVDTMLGSFRTLAGKVERSARNLLSLINEVLDYSKIEAGRMHLDRDETFCEDLVDDVLEGFRAKALEKGLTLEGESADISVFADEGRVRQILDNLVSNAIKFTDKGSVRVQAQAFGDFARFRIIDTGIGIPADRIDGIFEKFSQANTSDRRRAGGTGLGLAISKRFVEMHGGSITVTSREGEGSEFSFTIPKHIMQKSQKAEAMRAKPAA